MIDVTQLDDQDFYELVLRHLIRDPETMRRAVELKFKSDDMLTSEQTGIRIYKEFAQVAMEIGEAPIDKAVLKSALNAKHAKGLLVGFEKEETIELIKFIYDGELNSKFMLRALPEFIARRRMMKAHLDNQSDAAAAYKAMHQIAWEIQTIQTDTQAKSFQPFKKAVVKPTFSGIGTGFKKVDSVMQGIGLGEYGLIIGHSGAGKTALATNFLLKAVTNGYKALYISLEEPGENVADRLYAQQFKISYTDLHTGNGGVRMELPQLLDEIDPIIKDKLMNNLRIEDLRDMAPLNKDSIIVLLEKLAEEGFEPDLVMIDQLDYIEPTSGEDHQRWEKYELSSFEMDMLSHYKIKGRKAFALYVLHQAGGQMKLVYTNADIASCKGVIKPADVVICIGKEAPDAETVKVFTLKSRHSSNFQQTFLFEGHHMTFTEIEGAEEKKLEQKKTEKKRRKNSGGGITESDPEEPISNPMLQ